MGPSLALLAVDKGVTNSINSFIRKPYGLKAKYDVHMTLAQVEIIPDPKHDTNKLRTALETKMKDTKKKWTSCILTPQPNLKILGEKSKNQFITLEYNTNNFNISAIRKNFYQHIAHSFGYTVNRFQVINDNNGNQIICYQDPKTNKIEPVLKVKSFNWGRDKWLPHVSIASTTYDRKIKNINNARSQLNNSVAASTSNGILNFDVLQKWDISLRCSLPLTQWKIELEE